MSPKRSEFDPSVWDRSDVITSEELASLKHWSLKDACFDLMWEAYVKTTGDEHYHAPVRNLFYVAREMVKQYTDEELTNDWFSYNIVPEYQRTVRPLPLAYYDPRGELIEPHTGETIPLGTREIAEYELPKNLFNKILYIEKKGFGPAIKDTKLAEKYDMAIASSQGYGVEALRKLFQQIENERQEGTLEFRLFVLHDADPYGYEIARTLREETKRMPGYKVDVEDLGLTLADALRLGLPDEEFTRKNALSEKLLPLLDETELEWFTGEPSRDKKKNGQSKYWTGCRRVELNAFPIPDLLTYIETRLADLGATEKVIPSDEVLTTLAKQTVRKETFRRAYVWLAEHFDISRLATEFADEHEDDFTDRIVTNPREWITTAMQRDPTKAWGTAVTDGAKEGMDDLQDDIETGLRELIEQDDE